MKKLFGGKSKPAKPNVIPLQDEHVIPTPIHQQHAVYQHQQQQLASQGYINQPPRSLRRNSSEGERWEVVQGHDHNQYQAPSSPSHNSSYASLPPGASPPIPSPNGARSPSPFSINSNMGPRVDPPRKKPSQAPAAPVALRILGALDPANVAVRSGSEERFMTASNHSDAGHRERERDKDPPPPERKEKRGFWSRGDKDKDKEREKERERERGRLNDSRDHGRDKRQGDGESAELTRMIGYLTATASEDWGLVLEVTERVSASESNAKEAARALRREFKYGEPTAQLAAARLWAILLRNAKNEVFVYQSTSRKFTETLEDLLSSPRTSPVVRERVLDVIAAAAYASGKTTGFRTLWKRVKPADKPEEGMPLDNDDAMFNPPVSSRPHYDNNIPQVAYQEPSPFPVEIPTTPTPHNNPSRKHESRNRIIPPDEDIRRLFQECKIGQGNASLLSQALALSKPEDLKKKDVIKEFYLKCCSSQELIFAQIPWASAEAEKSRIARDQEALMNGHPEEQRLEQTTQERLLASLLSANAELMDALQQYEDLDRVAMERKAEEVSRKETRMDRRQLQQYQDEEFLADPSYVVGGTGNSPVAISRSPSPIRTATHTQQYHHSHSHSHSEIGGLAPPPPAPNGPRLPAHGNVNSMNNNVHMYTPSRTPSPVLDPAYESMQNGMAGMRLRGESEAVRSSVSISEYDDEMPIKPSAKALGKQRVVEEDLPEHYGEEDYYDGKDETYSMDSKLDTDDDGSTHEGWPNHRPTQFVYDAAAERTQQRIREGHLIANGVH